MEMTKATATNGGDLTSALITPEVKVQGSITSLIGMLFHQKEGSETYKALLSELLAHDDLRSPDDLQREADRFADDMRCRVAEFCHVLHYESGALL